MARELLIDANAILRYLIADHPQHAAAMQALLEQAERAEVRLRVTPLILAECAWVLRSFYKLSHEDISNGLLQFCALDGVVPDEASVSLEALRVFGQRRVDYADAYLAALGRAQGTAVATFDRDLARLGCEVVTPGS